MAVAFMETNQLGVAHANFSAPIVSNIESRVNLRLQAPTDQDRQDGGFLASDLLDYIYAVLHSPCFRKTFHDDEETLYYAQEVIRKGWSRDLLLNALKMKVHLNHPEPIDNNFGRTLPAAQAAYANEVFSSSYNLGFLGVTEPIAELELERRLVNNQ